FRNFLEKVDEVSSLYGDCDLRDFREDLGLSQRELAERLDTSRATVSGVEGRKRGLLRYWKHVDLKDPEYISSENFDLKIKNPFPIEISPAFMRIAGMLQGDGSLDSSGRESENKIDFRYHNTEKELVEQFCRDVGSIFGYRPDVRSQPPGTGEKTRYYVQLPAVVGRIISIITDGLSREWIREQSNRERYVGALLADEGHVSSTEPKIFISNTDKEILRNCRDILAEKGIESKINESQQKLYIWGRRNLEKFLEKIPVYSTRKHQALIDLLQRHYRYGSGKGSLEKQKAVLEALGKKGKTLEAINSDLDMSKRKVEHHLKLLREKDYAEKIIEGISERPRKKVLYRRKKDVSETFYSELSEKAFGEAHTATIESVQEMDYDGYVYDIID
ncbi:MAG: LAGLIDADG family homing endonuclease, partial [Candidatus Aenigmatarchaeota archaeon]